MTAKQPQPPEASADPKRDPHPPGNTEKDPRDWVSGDER
ncbi:hypothetical protein RHODGE_RHODGE_05021 [Rhodoplanes serenus]|uniref:Uncharacterized protein n=1 Tax=Rhodoplanes serenus TaxID=200615 RepID=A0A447D1Y0_9BRAD|nr:hypothetical protein RHODGE_RHODGE_05021 [Rhodoplanes serenus]